MKLYAISDLHLSHRINRQRLQEMPHFPEDWLILAGDVGATETHLHFALTVLTRRFAKVIWAPGNHDLWTLPGDRSPLQGMAKYLRLVAICRDYGVLTPEDPYVQWPGPGLACVLAPLFVLYDYSFRPDYVTLERAVDWAAESGVVCNDEAVLHPSPYDSRPTWCAARCDYSEPRLRRAAARGPLVLINHFPLREDLVRLFRIPRFSIWCGTERTDNWHNHFRAEVVVYGHLHIRGTDYRDGVRFEEVSLGYPQHWNHNNGIETYLREILPG